MDLDTQLLQQLIKQMTEVSRTLGLLEGRVSAIEERLEGVESKLEILMPLLQTAAGVKEAVDDLGKRVKEVEDHARSVKTLGKLGSLFLAFLTLDGIRRLISYLGGPPHAGP